jgi:hypothetical protein
LVSLCYATICALSKTLTIRVGFPWYLFAHNSRIKMLVKIVKNKIIKWGFHVPSIIWPPTDMQLAGASEKDPPLLLPGFCFWSPDFGASSESHGRFSCASLVELWEVQTSKLEQVRLGIIAGYVGGWVVLWKPQHFTQEQSYIPSEQLQTCKPPPAKP